MSTSPTSDQSPACQQAAAPGTAAGSVGAHGAGGAGAAGGAASGVRLSPEQYAAQFRQLDAEALYTFLAAVLVTAVFWLAVFLTHDSSVSLWHMPLWFVLSCLGGYVFSVAVVIILVKFFMKPCVLNVTSVRNDAGKGE